MTDPATFYRAEDRWDLPYELHTQGDRIPVEPYYVTIALRGSSKPEFVLMLPFTPSGKKNMIAWMAARSDPGHYGELVVYTFAKGAYVPGPEQIESQIDQDPQISQDLTLLGQEGSRTIRGNLLVIPVDDALVFVEPLYIEAEHTESVPEMKRVIVATTERVVMRPTLKGALAAVVGRGPVVTRAGQERAEAETVDDIVLRLRQVWGDATRARQQGNWTEFGTALDALSADLERLERAAGVPPAEPVTATLPLSPSLPVPVPAAP